MILLIPSFVIEVLNTRENSNYPFLITAAIYSLLILISSQVKPQSSVINEKTNSYVFISWFYAAFICSIPFWLSKEAQYPDFLSALFESTSAITSTGLSMAKNSSILSAQLQLYRAILQWAGGIGLAVWITYIVQDSEAMKSFYKVEEVGITDNLEFKKAAKFISYFYIVSTLIIALAFYFIEMNILDSICHAMSVFATGGFDNTGSSYTQMSSATLILSMIFMILSSTNFFLIYNSILNKRMSELLKNRYFLQYILFVIISVVSYCTYHGSFKLTQVFNLVSGITTTGLTAQKLSVDNLYFLIFLSMLMFIGGMVGSTSGGLKQRNISYLFRNLINFIAKKDKMKTKDLQQKNKRITKALVTLFLWFLFTFVSLMLLSGITAKEHPPTVNFFNIISALTNTGMSVGNLNYSIESSAKVIFILLMIVGRLSLYSLIYFIILLLKASKNQIAKSNQQSS